MSITLMEWNLRVPTVAEWVAKLVSLERGHQVVVEGSLLSITGDHLAPESKYRYSGQVEFGVMAVKRLAEMPTLSDDELWTLLN